MKKSDLCFVSFSVGLIVKVFKIYVQNRDIDSSSSVANKFF